MQQRQLRLGDILDDYCPRERRLTNHAVVAMVGADVKQTRCTTCDAEHEYKHAKVPRQRKKTDSAAGLTGQVIAGAPRRITGEGIDASSSEPATAAAAEADVLQSAANEGDELDADAPLGSDAVDAAEADVEAGGDHIEEGPVHRPLIRATLPRPEGQPPPARPAPDFTIRQPGGRPNRFRPRHQRGGGQQMFGNRNGNVAGGPPRGSSQRHGGGRPPQGAQGGMSARLARRQGRKRSK
jgi:hypothetical protein